MGIKLRQTDKLHFIPHIGINVRQTDKLFHFTPRFDVLDRPTDKLRLISSLILESTYDTRTNYVTFHPLYWNPRMTDGRTFHFTTHIGINVRQTDKLRFISPSTSDYVLFHSHVVVLDRQTDKLRFISLYLSSKWDRQTNHFISPLILESQQDRQTKQHFILHIGIFVRQTDRLHFISSFILESKHDRRKNYVSFHPLFWDQSKTDTRTGYVWFHPSFWRFKKTDGQITFHFTLLVGIQVKQTDKLRFCIPLILESK